MEDKLVLEYVGSNLLNKVIEYLEQVSAEQKDPKRLFDWYVFDSKGKKGIVLLLKQNVEAFS